MVTLSSARDLAPMVIDLFPRLTITEQRISLALYRLLAEGQPVVREALAARVVLPPAQVDEVLGKWYGVFYDAAGEIIGYWGLALREMQHRLQINCRTLYAWCAWDTLFLPQIIGSVAEITSACPVTAETIRLTVGPLGIEAVYPMSTMISFVTPERAKVEEDVVRNFCHHVHFFQSAEAAESWLPRHPGTLLLTPDHAWTLGHEKNAAQYGQVPEFRHGMDVEQGTAQ